MPGELPSQEPEDRTPETTHRRHDRKSKDVSTPSPTSRLTHNSAPEVSVTTKPPKPRPHFTDETVILQHGSESGAKTFCIRKELLDNLTPLWKGATEQRIILPKTNPAVLDMFVDFLNEPRDPHSYLPSHYSLEPWRSHAVDAWLFGNILCASNFERFALSHFIRSCALLDSSVFSRIENESNAKSSLCRFSKHWVAWNHSFAPDGKGEYTRLAAARLASVVTKSTNDPRIYDIDHWYSPCGDDINSSCTHDPVVRENAVKELFASRRPVPEEGIQWECENQPNRGKKGPVVVITPDEKKSQPSIPSASTLPPPPPYSPSGPSNLLQASAAVQALLSSISTLPPPPRPINPPQPPPRPRLRPKASILSKSSNAALRNSLLTSTVSNEPSVQASPVVERPRPSILAPPPSSQSRSSILASNSHPQAPNTGTTPLKQLTPMARFLLSSDIAPPPRTPAQLNESLRRVRSGVLSPKDK